MKREEYYPMTSVTLCVTAELVKQSLPHVAKGRFAAAELCG